jgi:ribonucleoside-diphosphate reductase beta chain
MKSILNSNSSHQPDEYGVIEAHFKRHENAHWTLDEIKLEKDRTNWLKPEIIDDNTKEFATNVFRFFTQGDEDIQDAYTDCYIPVIKNQNIRGLMLSFANREVLHVKAYRKLISDLGMPETIFSEFMEHKEMMAKHSYLKQFSVNRYFDPNYHLEKIEILKSEIENLEEKKKDPTIDNYEFSKAFYIEGIDERIESKRIAIADHKKDVIDNYENIIKNIAVFSAFTEGMQLFSSFVMLLNLVRDGMFVGIGDILGWSIKDETMHYMGMLEVYKILRSELRESGVLETNEEVVEFAKRLEKDLAKIAKDMVKLEDDFVDLCFSKFEHKGLTADDVKKYTRFICDRRLISLGCKPIYKIKDNPLPWVDELINGVSHTNFFEAQPTEYTKQIIHPTMAQLDAIRENYKAWYSPKTLDK